MVGLARGVVIAGIWTVAVELELAVVVEAFGGAMFVSSDDIFYQYVAS